ncbi:MAG TPA: Smr/MutS family protein [Afifellaceae bacterium]|nr:Smr/MutS family protein [Afifellaceae bacterium]
MSRRGKLTPEDRELWDRVLRSVRPIRPPERRDDNAAETDATGPAPTGRTAPPPPTARRKGKPPSAPSYSPPVSAPKPDRAPGLAPLEPRRKRRLARGSEEVEARLDLHGMRQSTAFHTLIGFLRQARARRIGTVLVITGKGRADGPDDARGGERGVLRRLVPQWLARPEFRDLVIGFEPAARRHGGEGALYVRVRRAKSSDR